MDNYNKPSPNVKEAKKSYAKIGIAASVMIALMVGVPYIVYWLVGEYAQNIFNEVWFPWAAAVAPLYLVAVPAFLLITKKLPKALPEKNPLKPRNWFNIIAVSAACLYGGSLVSNFLMQLVGGFTGKVPENGVTEMLMNSDVLVNLVIVGLLAPVIEELVFRKVLLDRTRIYGEKTAIFFSALAFALFHGNFYQFFYAFGLGLILAYIYMRTGKIRNTIFLHMGINLTTGVLMSWLAKQFISKLPEEIANAETFEEIMTFMTADEAAFVEKFAPVIPYTAGIMIYYFLLFAMAITGFVIIVVNKNRLKFTRTGFEIPREQIGNTVYMNVGVIAMVTISAMLLVYSLF